MSRRFALVLIVAACLVPGLLPFNRAALAASDNPDAQLRRVLREHAFTGRVQQTLQQRLGRRVDPRLANLGRLLWFDKSGGLRKDNTCGGCHSPANGFGDSQSISIGVQNNNVVGDHRAGPRNQRRAPSAINVAFYPALMWNGRFSAVSGNPFDNSRGFFVSRA